MKRTRRERRRSWEVLCPTLHDARRLTSLRHSLEAFLCGSEDDAVAKTARRPGRWVGMAAAPALSYAVREFMLRRSYTLREFLPEVLLPTLRVALEFNALFAAAPPPPADTPASSTDTDRRSRCCSVAVNQPHVTFTRRQVWCVLANMFLCAFRSRTEASADFSTDEDEYGTDGANMEWVDAGLLPTTDYTEIHGAPDGANNVEVTKLLLLFTFFAEAQAWTAEECEEQDMTAYRTRAEPSLAQALLPKVWRAPSASSPPRSAPLPLPSLQPLVLHPLGESIDDQADMIRVDFANRWVGGGALSAGAVQEEITFAQCPALNTLRWFHSRLGHAESVVVTHYRQYGRVQAGSYGSTLRYGEALSPPRTCPGALLVVDALDFRYDSVDECSGAAVYRELMKLVGGLSSAALSSLSCVAGGNWGCGVFGGNHELKFLLQWAACGVTGKALHYFPFDNGAFAAFVPHVVQRWEGGCVPPLTTAALLTFLYALEDVSEASDDDMEEEEETAVAAGPTFGFVWTAFLRHFNPVARA